MTRTLAIVPARAGSKRVPNKNRREFLGRPLILWTLDFALSLRTFDRVLVSTDSQALADLALSAGGSVPWLRPAELASDTAASVDVVLDVLERLESEGERFARVALLQPTSPLRLANRWNEAQRLMDQGASAVIGVRPATDHPFWTYFVSEDAGLEPCHPDKLRLRSQDLPPAYVPNGSLYMIQVDVLKAEMTFAPAGCRAVVCSETVESIDIDTEQDWRDAERAVASWKETL